jgi:hypothetical protein
MQNKLTISQSEEDTSEEISEFEEECNKLLIKITENYREQRNDIRNLVKLYKKETKIKQKKSKVVNQSGFNKSCAVPNKLLDYLKIEKNTVMTRGKLTSLLSKEFEKRGLYHPTDRRIILPDDELKKLFNLPPNSDKSDDCKDPNGLNFYNLQKYIAIIYNENKNVNQVLTI